MLADVATPSGDALRAFLEGEAAFERFEIRKALEAYDRATELDSNFVQAWLRKAHVRSAGVLPPDAEVARRLDELYDRMPARDQALRRAFPPGATFDEQVSALQAIAARFAEYHMAQSRAIEVIISSGPLHGVPIETALPYLDRLDSLAPRHADNAQRRWMVAASRGDTAGLRASAQRLAELAAGPLGGLARSFTIPSEAYARTGQYLDAATATAALRAGAESMRELPVIAELALLLPPPFTAPAQLDSAYAAIANDLEVRAFQRQYLFGVGSHQFSRGDVPSAIRTFARLERMDAPADVRTTGIRSAALASWLGLISSAEAEAAASESRRALADGSATVRLEVNWSDAILAIVARDSVRFHAALRALADTSLARQTIARGLRALWRERITGSVDSLLAHDDHTMRRGQMYIPNVALTRLAIGRALTVAGDPERAEYYLQWTDAVVAGRRNIQVLRAVMPYRSYQRGLAAEAAGDRRAAILHLRRFVTFVDRPPPRLADQIRDAKARLARLLAKAD
jgi:tetratricopeptide (TPR) repeat protein